MSKLKDQLLQIFTWWHGQTIGTRFYTWRFGQPVGTDEGGNRYYQTTDGKRRWVVYNGDVDASRIPPGWYGWIHHRFDVPPPKEDYRPREWEKPHERNLTGTGLAYRPKGSLLSTEERPRVTGDYDAWTP